MRLTTWSDHGTMTRAPEASLVLRSRGDWRVGACLDATRRDSRSCLSRVCLRKVLSMLYRSLLLTYCWFWIRYGSLRIAY